MEITKISYREKLLITSSLGYLLDEGCFKHLGGVLGEDTEEFVRNLIDYIDNVPSEDIFKEINHEEK